MIPYQQLATANGKLFQARSGAFFCARRLVATNQKENTMMINKRLIGAVPESKKYIAGNVALQWCCSSRTSP